MWGLWHATEPSSKADSNNRLSFSVCKIPYISNQTRAIFHDGGDDDQGSRRKIRIAYGHGYSNRDLLVDPAHFVPLWCCMQDHGTAAE